MGNLNLRAVFSADTKGLTAGVKEAKQGIRDFEKTSNDAVKGIGDAFGVNTEQIEKMTSAVRGMGLRLSESANAGTAAFGKMLSSISAAGTAIAGLGIGAVVASFKALNAEATNFKNTVAGASIDMQTMAYVQTYSQVLHDFNAENGKSVAEFESKWQKAWGMFKADAQQAFVGGLTGNKFNATTILGPIGGALFGGNNEQSQQARAAAERAQQITADIFALERQLVAKGVEWAKTDAEIAEYRRIAKDDSYTLSQQQSAIASAAEAINSRYNEEYAIRKRISDLQTVLVGLAGSSVEDENKMYDAQKATADVMRNKETMLKSLSREQKSLTKQVNAEAAARQAAAQAAAAEHNAAMTARASILNTDLTITPGTESGLTGQATTMQIGAVIKPTYDPKEILDISQEVAGLVADGIASMSESIGGLIGDLAAGGDAWGNFKNSALGAFGDMAISVGKMAIATGVATLGIKAALESLNGAVAIAAGAALVALGSAVKAGLSNVASGNYSASTSVASGGYSSLASGGGYGASMLNIKVDGVLTAKGNTLLAVINSENKRRNTSS